MRTEPPAPVLPAAAPAAPEPKAAPPVVPLVVPPVTPAAQPLPVQEWVSVPSAPLPPENRVPVVIEEPRGVVPEVPDGK